MLIVLKNGEAIKTNLNIVFEPTSIDKLVISLSFMIGGQVYKVLASEVKRIEP